MQAGHEVFARGSHLPRLDLQPAEDASDIAFALLVTDIAADAQALLREFPRRRQIANRDVRLRESEQGKRALADVIAGPEATQALGIQRDRVVILPIASAAVPRLKRATATPRPLPCAISMAIELFIACACVDEVTPHVRNVSEVVERVRPACVVAELLLDREAPAEVLFCLLEVALPVRQHAGTAVHFRSERRERRRPRGMASASCALSRHSL